VSVLPHLNSATTANVSGYSYIRERRGKKLQDCADAITRYETKIRELGLDIEKIRKNIAQLDKEINEGGAALTNLRENRRIRKLQSDIQHTQDTIDSCDLEGAAKAKRNFEEKYQPEKDRESEMQQKVVLLRRLWYLS
jgi:DNA repair protein RAD50